MIIIRNINISSKKRNNAYRKSQLKVKTFQAKVRRSRRSINKVNNKSKIGSRFE